MVCTLLAGVNVVAFAADDLDDTISVQKFYFDATKGGNGEHIYTVDEDEISWYKSLPSWNDEGEAWKAPLFSEVPVYRVANYNTGEHLWITDKGYVDYLVGLGWTQEQGVAFYSDENMGVPVYRLWNGTDGVGSHHFTTNEEEIAWLVSTGWTNEGPQFYGVKEEEPGEKEMTALQSGSKEITVTTTDEFTGLEEFTVMKGAVEQSVASVDFDDDMCSATLTMDSNIQEAEYTVICSDLEYEPASFTGEVGKLSAIFISDDLIDMSATLGANKYAVGYKTVDQWGNDFAVTAFDSMVCSAQDPNTAIVPNDGMLIITSTAALTVGTQHSVSLVKGTVVGTQTVTVSAASVVADITVGELTPTVNEALINTTGRIDVDDVSAGDRYYFTVSATDQYGNPLNKTALNALAANKLLIVSPDSQVASGVIYAAGTGATVFDELDDGTPIMYVQGDGRSYGAGLINLVSVSGAKASATATIAQNERIEDLTVLPASTTFQVNKPVLAMIVATNNYGETVDMYKEVKLFQDAACTAPAATAYPYNGTLYFQYTGGDSHSLAEATSHMDLNNAVVAYEDDAATKTRGFGFIGLTKGSATVTTYAAGGTKVTPAVFTVNDSATVAGIKGLADGTDTTFASTGSTINVSLNDVRFIDSDGDVIDPTQYATVYKLTKMIPNGGAAPQAGDYFVKVTEETGKIAITANGATGVTLDPAAATPGKTYKVKMTLYAETAQGSSEITSKTFDYKVFNAADKNMTFTAVMLDASVLNAGLKLPKSTLYVGEEPASADIAIVGLMLTDSNGATVVADDIGLAYDVDVVGADLDVDYGTIVNNAWTVSCVGGDDELGEGEATVRVWVNGTLVDIDTLAYNIDNPEALAVIAIDANAKVVSPSSFNTVNAKPTEVGGVLTIVDGTNNYKLFAVDQYGQLVNDAKWTLGGKAIAQSTIAAGKTSTLSVSADSLTQSWSVTSPNGF